ncbi:hypothetical protein KGF54_000216 [Candida jiufengensis]|uniref:uncharacterized protein n=1 Tax=Candida jiufengensis TaxID=497108 RepID=UPI0022241EC2|nr:uncharacterized protein KGF54_000216 [Candida jiufengensis]KAI5957288.1 hypothetical protein KGF54_000216 [Candida jiufengensis]
MTTVPELLSFLLLASFLSVLDILSSLLSIMSTTKQKLPKLNNAVPNTNLPIEGSSKPKSPKQQEIKENVTKGLPDLLTPKHLKTYPLVNSSENIYKMLPFSGYLLSISKYSFTTIRNYQPMKYILETGDLYSDMLLTKLDSFIPSLQTVEITDLTSPITSPINHAVETVNTKINLVNDTVNKNVINPTKSKIDDVKNDIHQRTHDENGKNIIAKSTIDPIITPFNETLEQFVSNHFPDKKVVPRDDDDCGRCEFSSELKRTFNIVGNIISKESKETVEVNLVDLKGDNIADNKKNTKIEKAKPVKEKEVIANK